jgi:Protein of unknown function (DUF3048) N-terminal domain/Protein of unknown function (DUF3048) C-terminal domain
MIRRSLVVLVALGLLAACGGGGKKAASTTTTATTIATTTTPPPPPPVSPLTGLPATDPEVLKRPALVVKIDNADGNGSGNQARPQVGLNQADVVYEEMVEGSVTRLAAIFQSADSDPVGPIRSARTTDVALFSPLNNPLFAWSGANADFVVIIHAAPLIDVGYSLHSDLYTRRDTHPGPHNLYSSTPQLYGLTPPDAIAPPPLFEYRAAGEALSPTAKPVGSVHLQFGGGGGSAPVDYSWNTAVGGFDRSQKGTPHVDENGTQITPPNVVIEFVDYVDTGYVDVSGAPVPEAQLVGTGTCWVLTNGMLVEGQWTKASPEAVTTYADAAGAPIKLTPGRTWVELTPNGGATITG